MIYGSLVTWLIAVYLIVGTGLAFTVYSKVRRTWKKCVEGKQFTELTYKGEAFRSPIRFGILVYGILIPLASGLFAYQARTHPGRSLDLLVAALIFMLLAMAWGIYQVYSLATQSAHDDAFKITKQSNWLVPADFACQLSVGGIGVVFLMLFLVFYFNPVTVDKPVAGVVQTEQHAVFRAHPSLGITDNQMANLWGTPFKVETDPAGLTRFIYEGPTSRFLLGFRNKRLVQIIEESPQEVQP